MGRDTFAINRKKFRLDISDIIVFEPKSANAFNVSGRLRAGAFFRVRSLAMTQRQVAMTAEEQVAYLRDEKSIGFELVNEEEACTFLSDRNYFFKIKAFAKNYDKRIVEGNAKGKYINLDFGHLVELSRLDKHLRDLVLMLTLDIEHNLKVRINRAAMRQGTDPYDLTVRYLALSHANVVADQMQKFDDAAAKACLGEIKQSLEDVDRLSNDDLIATANRICTDLIKITQSRNPDYVHDSFMAMETSPYSKNVVRKYKDQAIPYWCLMELMSFGPVIALYKACFKKDGLISDDHECATLKETGNLLRRAQVLRNAAAHEDCLLNSLTEYRKDSSTSSVRRKLATYNLDENIVAQVASVQIAMDFAATLMCYDIVVPSGESRSEASSRFADVTNRMIQHEDWFTKNYAISSFLDFVSQLHATFKETLREQPAMHV